MGLDFIATLKEDDKMTRQAKALEYEELEYEELEKEYAIQRVTASIISEKTKRDEDALQQETKRREDKVKKDINTSDAGTDPIKKREQRWQTMIFKTIKQLMLLGLFCFSLWMTIQIVSTNMMLSPPITTNSHPLKATAKPPPEPRSNITVENATAKPPPEPRSNITVENATAKNLTEAAKHQAICLAPAKNFTEATKHQAICLATEKNFTEAAKHQAESKDAAKHQAESKTLDEKRKEINEQIAKLKHDMEKTNTQIEELRKLAGDDGAGGFKNYIMNAPYKMIEKAKEHPAITTLTLAAIGIYSGKIDVKAGAVVVKEGSKYVWRKMVERVSNWGTGTVCLQIGSVVATTAVERSLTD